MPDQCALTVLANAIKAGILADEDVYLQKYANMPDLQLGLADYFKFYNEERLHQSLGYTTPNTAYQTAKGGGAKIVDRFSSKQRVSSTSEELGQRHPDAM